MSKESLLLTITVTHSPGTAGPGYSLKVTGTPSDLEAAVGSTWLRELIGVMYPKTQELISSVPKESSKESRDAFIWGLLSPWLESTVGPQETEEDLLSRLIASYSADELSTLYLMLTRHALVSRLSNPPYPEHLVNWLLQLYLLGQLYDRSSSQERASLLKDPNSALMTILRMVEEEKSYWEQPKTSP